MRPRRLRAGGRYCFGLNAIAQSGCRRPGTGSRRAVGLVMELRWPAKALVAHRGFGRGYETQRHPDGSPSAGHRDGEQGPVAGLCPMGELVDWWHVAVPASAVAASNRWRCSTRAIEADVCRHRSVFERQGSARPDRHDGRRDPVGCRLHSGDWCPDDPIATSRSHVCGRLRLRLPIIERAFGIPAPGEASGQSSDQTGPTRNPARVHATRTSRLC